MSHAADLDKSQFRHNDVYKNLSARKTSTPHWNDLFTTYAAEHDHEEEARHVDEWKHAKDHA